MNNKNKAWVDCFCDKFCHAYTDVPEYMMFMNLWNIDFNIDVSQLSININNSTDQFRKLTDFYNIISKEVELDNNTLVTNKFPLFIYSDLFYLPYCKVNYNRNHLNHRILILRSDVDGKCYIYDDLPFYNGFLDYKIVKEANKGYGGQYFDTSNLMLKSNSEELEYIFNHCEYLYETKQYINELVKLDITNLEKMKIIDKSNLILCKFNSLSRFGESLFGKYNNKEMFTVIEDFNKYNLKWKLIIMLCKKALEKNDYSIWERVKQHLCEIEELEHNVRKQVYYLKYKILPFL